MALYKFRILKRICLLGFILFSTGSLLANETKPSNGVNGIWVSENDSSSQKLNANWIWTEENLDSEVVLARKVFSVKEGFEKVMLRITASSQYQLYINGEYVSRGPARSAPHHQSYDVLNITKMIKNGENVIAARIHHQEEVDSYNHEGRAGFLAEMVVDSSETISSDSTWKVLPDPSWDNEAPLISRFHREVNDRVDFRKYLKGWNSLDFNDSKWQAATELMRTTGWPGPQKNASAQSLTPPWTSLYPRDIPYLKERNLKADNLIEAVELTTPIVDQPHSLTGQVKLNDQKPGNLEIPAPSNSRSWLLIYDFGEVINGMPRLDIEGEAGTEIEIITAPFIVDKNFTHITVDSRFRDKIILSGNRDQWEATYFKPTRYLGIVITNDAAVKLFSAGIHQIEYPFEERGLMISEDAPWINNYFNATAKTINVTTTDAFTDNYRERRQYAQTGYYAALGNYWIFGDYALQRRYLNQVAQEQYANGIMPAYAPLVTDDYMVILDSNCLWIRSLRNYYLYSGDEETLRKLLPAAEKLMRLLNRFTNTNGLLENPPYPYWLDHAVNDRRGANFTLNGHYLGALKDFAEILDWLQMDNNVYLERASNLRSSMNLLWDEERQLFADALIDGERSELFSEHAQAMALSMNVASKEQAQLIAKKLFKRDDHNYIKRESGITMVTPAMSYFLHKGLANYGFINESFEMFRNRFGKMLDSDTNGTLWEEWWVDGTGRSGTYQGGRTRSDAQTESAFPPALFAEYLLGIQVTEPGMKELEITRYDTNIENIQGNIPTPNGIVAIEWDIQKNNGKLTLQIPSGITVNVNSDNLDISKSGIVVNGEKWEETKGANTPIKLATGSHTIKF